MASNQSRAEILLELLDKVPDADKLEKLLEPENPLRLLQIRGRDPGELRQELASGRRLGELLLELLEQEPDPDRLIAQLGPSKSECTQLRGPI